MHNNLAWQFSEKKSRVIFFLFLKIDKTSDFDILTNSWAQWVEKKIKVSSQSDLV
jgi:hypothetical protein